MPLPRPSPNRPYRVGMAREAQRYIEPDEIYEDLKRGAPTEIPREFPYTWNPVNGLGATGGGVDRRASMGDLLSDLVNIGKGAQTDLTNSAEEQAKNAILNNLNSTPAGRALLDKLKSTAAEGVTDVVKSAAPNLIMLAVAGGAVGGLVGNQLGKAGTVLMVGVAGFAIFKLLTLKPPA